MRLDSPDGRDTSPAGLRLGTNTYDRATKTIQEIQPQMRKERAGGVADTECNIFIAVIWSHRFKPGRTCKRHREKHALSRKGPRTWCCRELGRTDQMIGSGGVVIDNVNIFRLATEPTK